MCPRSLESSAWWRHQGVILALLATLLTMGCQARVKLTDHGYEGLVIAISPTLDEELAPTIIPAIKHAIQEASSNMFQGSRRRLHFRKARILIPKTWTNTTVDAGASSENFEEAEIRIDVQNKVYKHQPYTKQHMGCGDPGLYIHLTPKYLTDDQQASWWGDRGKVILMEWAKLRWGVFDEFGYADDKIFPLFYHHKGPEDEHILLKPTHCADEEINGWYLNKMDPKKPCGYDRDRMPDSNCRFLPGAHQIAKSSLMAYPFIRSDTVNEFCDLSNKTSHPHNPHAPTKQNFHCKHQSVWEVMRKHPDFAADKTFNVGIDVYQNVSFEVVRESAAHYVMVLDYSGSMQDFDRIMKLKRTAQRWLLHDVAEESSVAIVKFSISSALVSKLTKITGKSSRKKLADLIDTKIKDSTCIGCGLELAIRELQGKENPVILLVTDGKENQEPYINEMLDHLDKNGIRVVTIAFGKNADQSLEMLASTTGGKTFTVNDEDEGTMLNDAFEGALTYQPTSDFATTPIKIHEERYKGKDTKLTRSFIVDSGVGKNLEFRLETNDVSHLRSSLILKSPKGQIFSDAQLEDDLKMWKVKIKRARPGKWTWNVDLSGNPDNYINVNVLSNPRASDGPRMPITTKAWVSSGSKEVNLTSDRVIVFAEVKKGQNPVIGAHVTAIIVQPNADLDTPPQTLELHDDGNDPDMVRNDGIYSKYLASVPTTGRYSVKAQVMGGKNTLVSKDFLTSRRRRSISANKTEAHPDRCCGSFMPFDISDAVPTGIFTRVAAAGSIKITAIPATNPDGVVEDITPPARVHDLKVSEIMDGSNKMKIQLSWTATGDDHDTGIASLYTFRITKNQDDLYDENFDAEIDFQNQNARDPSILLEAGSKMVMNVTLGVEFEWNQLYYLALRAEDDEGLKSPVSNHVNFFFHSESEAVTAPTKTTQSLPFHNVVTVAVVGALLLKAVLLTMAVCYCRRRKTFSPQPL